MLFLTNRHPLKSCRSKPGRTIELDLDHNAPSNNLYFCKRNGVDNYTEICSSRFFEEVSQSVYRGVLFYIHGSDSLPEPDIFPISEMMQKLFDKYEKEYIQVIPVIWPCDNQMGIVKDWWDDRLSAEASAYSFSRLIERFQSWRVESSEPCLKSINVLCHDLGCAVFEKTTNVWSENFGNGYFPMMFKNLFLVAGNIRNDIFREGESGQNISTSSRNVSIYYSANDMILSGAFFPNQRPPMINQNNGTPLGISGPKYFSDTPPNVKAIDCSDIGSLYDFPAGHTYYLTGGDNELGLAGIVFDHIFETIKTGRIDTIDGRLVTLPTDS